MITREMLKTLQNIRRQEQNHGAAVAPEIKVYQHRTTLYGALRKLEKLEAINQQDAPTTSNVQKTYTTTGFGEKLLDKAVKAEMIEKW